MAHVSIRSLGKRFGQAPASLDNINVDIGSGEFVVLVGPSGCGKSTLLRCVAGLETPTSGSIEIDGKRVDNLPPADRGVGMVFQNYALYPHMNVRENLSFGLKMRRIAREEIKKRVDEAAAMLELTSLMTRKPSQLSGGQRQRVAIGRALVKRPQVFLLDEPLSNLDAQLRSQTRLELAALHRRIRSTTLYVTHDQEEAMTLADRIVVLKAGRLQQVAPPLELYHHPANRFVASFIGSPKMNFLQGDLSIFDQRAEFRTDDQTVSFSSASSPARSGRYWLGFRPEAFRWSDAGLKLRLDWIEHHGFDVHLIASLAGERITLRVPERELPAVLRSAHTGTVFGIELETDQTHWFSTEGDELRVECQRLGSC